MQRVVSYSAVQSLGRNPSKSLRCTMEVSIGLKSTVIFLRPLALRPYRGSEAIDEKRCRQIENIKHMHNALSKMHKEVVENNTRRRTLLQKRTQRKNEYLTDIYLSWRTCHDENACKEEAQTSSTLAVPNDSNSSEVVFYFRSRRDKRHTQVSSSCAVRDSVSCYESQIAGLKWLKDQPEQYNTKYHLFHWIDGTLKQGGEHELLVKM